MIELLKNIRVLLAELHPATEKNKSSLSKSFLLKYHIGNYFLRLTTYKDLALQFIIEVEKMKIKGKNCLANKIDALAQKDNLTGIPTLTKSLRTMFRHVSDIRNELAHEGGLSDVDIQLIDLSFEFSKDVPEVFDEKEMTEYFNAAILKNILEMQQIEEDIATNFFETMNKLKHSYCKNKLLS